MKFFGDISATSKVFARRTAKLMLLTLLMVPFSRGEARVPQKNRLTVNGFTVTAPLGWEIWQESDLKSIVMAPQKSGFHAENNQPSVFFYYDLRSWPYGKVEESIPELKKKDRNSEVEVRNLNGRDWIIYKSKTQMGTNYHAKASVAPKTYVNAWCPEISRDQFLAVLSEVKFPDTIK